MKKKCSRCNGEMIKAVNTGNDVVSAEALFEKNFYTSSYIDKYFCLECGYIEEYVRNPRVFIDPKYKNMDIEERSNYKDI